MGTVDRTHRRRYLYRCGNMDGAVATSHTPGHVTPTPHACPGSDKDCGRDAEPIGQRTRLASVNFAFAVQHLTDIRLGAKNLREVSLPQVVLLHEKSEHGGRFCVRNLDIAFLIIPYEEGHDIEQPHERVSLPVADLID